NNPGLFFLQHGHFDAENATLVKCGNFIGIDIDGQNDGSAELSPEAFLGKIIGAVDGFRLFSHAAYYQDVVGDGDRNIFDGNTGDGRKDHQFVLGLVDVHGHGSASLGNAGS